MGGGLGTLGKNNTTGDAPEQREGSRGAAVAAGMGDSEIGYARSRKTRDMWTRGWEAYGIKARLLRKGY